MADYRTIHGTLEEVTAAWEARGCRVLLRNPHGRGFYFRQMRDMSEYAVVDQYHHRVGTVRRHWRTGTAETTLPPLRVVPEEPSWRPHEHNREHEDTMRREREHAHQVEQMRVSYRPLELPTSNLFAMEYTYQNFGGKPQKP